VCWWFAGAYNRTLTPFGFQSEERTLWQAPEIYSKMSPFMWVLLLKRVRSRSLRGTVAYAGVWHTTRKMLVRLPVDASLRLRYNILMEETGNAASAGFHGPQRGKRQSLAAGTRTVVSCAAPARAPPSTLLCSCGCALLSCRLADKIKKPLLLVHGEVRHHTLHQHSPPH
jgi:hypothetical protein